MYCIQWTTGHTLPLPQLHSAKQYGAHKAGLIEMDQTNLLHHSFAKCLWHAHHYGSWKFWPAFSEDLHEFVMDFTWLDNMPSWIT